MAELQRCTWCTGSRAEQDYHDREWGVPLRDDNRLFEFFLLDGFQAGLSWKTILLKRENYRQALFGFDAQRLAACGTADVVRWMEDPGLVRNRLKLEGAIRNARAFLRVREEFGSFSAYVWQFTGNRVADNALTGHSPMPAESPESVAMSRDMRKRGFTFCGPVICYAFMQAAGLVNDHLTRCFRYREVGFLS